MLAMVEVPLWLLALMVVLTGVALLDRFLVPSVRWFFRRRFLRAVERLNTRLALKLQPFKLMRRRDTVERLVHDPEVMEAVLDHSRRRDAPPDVAMQRAYRYAREIVPSFSAFVYFSVATRLAKWLSRALYRVTLHVEDEAALAAIDPEATVVFVMNHRSNMDYVLVTHLAADRSALSYAVGEWARVWPLQPLIRAMGGYFIRRNSQSALYRRVLARYVALATEGGVTQAIFPEGGLTRDGGFREAKLGILSYVVAGARPGRGRDVVFVPVALNYDRVLEDRVLTAAQDGPPRRFRVRLGAFLGYVLRQVVLRLLRHGFHRAQAGVGFGRPLSLAAFAGPGGTVDVAALGAELMARIGASMPVLPVALLAAVLVEAERPLTRDEAVARALALARALAARGARLHLPESGEEAALKSAFRMIGLRGLLSRAPGRTYSAAAKDRRILAFYARSVAHLRPGAPALAESRPAAN